MFAVDRLVLLAGILLVLGIASSKLSTRMGLPVLALFLLVGMLAGSEGIGGIAFENYAVAHGVGTVALALILFDGGLRTHHGAFRAVLAPSVVLATAGVLLTAIVTGLAATALLELSLLEGLLLGSIAGSTDAAAVFAVLRSRGMRLPARLATTVEAESGSNDPMAVFLTIACLEVLTGRLDAGPGVLWLFVRQMAVGAAAGWAVGRLTTAAVNRINLDAAGLYPVLTGAAALLAYGLAATFGGSGFLSVYLAGILIGSRRLVFRRGVFLFHDGLAWLAQIIMFVLLGLLSFPSRLLEVAAPAVLVALALMLVARPVAVVACLAPFRYGPGELAFVSWAGLKGAVPIILATYPLLLGVPGAALMFDVVFFVVLVSAMTQGWTLHAVARALGLLRPPEPEPPVTLEITSLRDVDGDIVEYTVAPGARAAGRRLRELALPDGVVVAMIAREQRVIPPRGSTQLLPGDLVFVLLRPAVRPIVDRIFATAPAGAPALPAVEFPLRGSTTVQDLEDFYGITIDAPKETTLDRLLRERLEGGPTAGARLTVDAVTLVVADLSDSGIETVLLMVNPEGTPPPERERPSRDSPEPIA
jgi:cell volume regulation protein A